MSCHEIAALRLGLMTVLGRDDEAERQHELAELGAAAASPGPLLALTAGRDLAGLQRAFAAAASDLEAKVSGTPAGDAKLGYLRTLVVLCKKVELDLDLQVASLTRLYNDLETVHDVVHEIFRGSDVAVVHTATVLDARPIGGAGRLLTLALAPGGDGPLGFVGGQYVIVDSGRTLPSGRAAKRAYSMISPDAEQGRCELVVKHIVRDEAGAVSSFLHEVAIGASFPFSGPWGKFVAGSPAERTLVLSTDTGITAALGLLAGRAFDDRVATTDAVWLADDSFVPEDFVVSRLADRCASLRVLRPHHGDRIGAAVATALELAHTRAFDAVYLSGDGDVLYPVKAALCECGVAEDVVRIESFFNVPKVDRKVP